MADQIQSTAREAAAIVPEVWSTRLYDVLLAELPFASVIDTSYGSEVASMGDVIHVSEVPEFADIESELPEGAVNDASSVTIKGYPININKRVAMDYIVTKRSELQSLSHTDTLRERAVYSIMKRIQRIIIDTINPIEANDVAITDSQITLAEFINAKKNLDNQNVPLSGRYAVLTPVSYTHLTLPTILLV